MKKVILLTFMLCTLLSADISDKAIEAYNKGNFKSAISYFEEIANNDIMAQYRLGVMYEKGQGTKINKKQSFYWHKKAAENGHAISQYLLAEKYSDKNFTFYNSNIATHWYQKSAEQGYFLAQYKLGILYIKGSNVLRDYKKAKFWIHKSNDNGSYLARIAWKKYKLWEY
jgi:hypothetical protein